MQDIFNLAEIELCDPSPSEEQWRGNWRALDRLSKLVSADRIPRDLLYCAPTYSQSQSLDC